MSTYTTQRLYALKQTRRYLLYFKSKSRTTGTKVSIFIDGINVVNLTDLDTQTKQTYAMKFIYYHF